MNFGRKIRRYWHDVYYKISSKKGENFAMSCKDISKEVDLGEVSQTFFQRFRFYLHISLCQACKNYTTASAILKKAACNLIRNQKTSVSLDKLNDELIKKYTKKKV